MNGNEIDRRQLLGRISLMFGSALAAPLVSSVLAGTAGAQIPRGKPGQLLSADEAMFLSLVADIIIPRTDTASASEAGVVGFIDRVVAEYEDAPGRNRFKAGLKAFYAFADEALGGCFVSSSPAKQQAWIEEFDKKAFAKRSSANAAFYRSLKRMIVTGYYVSEPGASEELAYLGVPGPYQGVIPVTDETRTWAN